MNYNNIWKGQLEEVLVGGVYVDVWYFPNCVRGGGGELQNQDVYFDPNGW
jgi:hypothetical protein